MTYVVTFKKSARKEINKLSPQLAKCIFQAIDKLAVNPRRGNVKSMVGTNNWRLRVDDYRVIYGIYDKKLIIEVIKVGLVSRVYK